MRRILLIHPGAMGDLIQALPAFERLRAHFAGDHVALLVGDRFADLARGWELFDETIAFDAATAYHGGWRERGRLLMRLVRRLRAERYDAVGTFKAAPVYAVLALLSGARARVGLTRGAGARLLTIPIPIEPRDHQEERFLRVARGLGARGDEAVRARWPAGPEALSLLSTERRELLIGIAPGGGNVKGELTTRRWPAERYVALCERLLERHPDAHVVVVGAPSDREVADRIAGHLPDGRVSNLAGRTSVPAARDLIAACHVFVTNDSGLLHLAGSTEAPVVAIFGPTSPAVLCPRRPLVEAIWHPVRPGPCYDSCTGALRPCARPCCIEQCSVEEVFERAHRLLSSMPRSGAAGRATSSARL